MSRIVQKALEIGEKIADTFGFAGAFLKLSRNNGITFVLNGF